MFAVHVAPNGGEHQHSRQHDYINQLGRMLYGLFQLIFQLDRG